MDNTILLIAKISRLALVKKRCLRFDLRVADDSLYKGSNCISLTGVCQEKRQLPYQDIAHFVFLVSI